MAISAQKNSQNFHEKLSRNLSETKYNIVNNRSDRDSVFQLRYRCYRKENLIPSTLEQKFSDNYDSDPNSIIFGARTEDAIVGSIRIHLLSKEHPLSPAYDTYHDILDPLVKNGETMIDPSRFVIDPLAHRKPLVPFSVIRLACMMAEHFEADWMLATVRPEHAAFYKRFCSLQPMAEARPYPGLSCPLMLLGARNKEVQDHVFERYPIFSSTLAERLALFGTERTIERFGIQPANDAENQSAQHFDPAFRIPDASAI